MPRNQRSWLFHRTRLRQEQSYSLLAGVQFLGMNTESRLSYFIENRLPSFLSLFLSVCPVSIRYRSAEFGEMSAQERVIVLQPSSNSNHRRRRTSLHEQFGLQLFPNFLCAQNPVTFFYLSLYFELFSQGFLRNTFTH